MGKIEFHMLIKHYFLRGKSIKETEEMLAKYHKESASSHGMVHKWFSERGIPVGRVWHILHECLGMRELSVRLVPRLLTADHKRAHVVASEPCLGMFQRNSKEFLRRYVTVDETRIHYYTSETKNQSKMWTGPGESAPQKAKTVPSAGKVMVTIFHINRLSTKGKNYYGRVLCLIIRSI